MNTKQPTPQKVEYLCPGERQPISRAVHLGRLAAFYPACRQCPHREETGTLSPRQVEQLAETSARRRPRPLFHEEGAGGVFLDDLTPADARRIAAAFGVMVRQEERREKREERRERGEEKEDHGRPSIHHSSFIIHHSAFPQSPTPNPSVLLAGDGRPMTAELVAAVAEGLRWSGCEVADIGPATAACLAFAVHYLQAAGGVLVGNPGRRPHEVGLQFWRAGPRPLSAGGALESVAQLTQTDLSRPTRRFGRMRRFQADAPYLAAISEHYHALRPLRVVVDSASKPLTDYLQRLCAAVACEIIPLRVARRDLPERVRAEGAHFAVQIDGDGETCRAFDEQGRDLPAPRLLLLMARHIRDDAAISGEGDSSNSSPVAVVLENGFARAAVERLERLGFHPLTSGPRRADVSDAMREHNAALGGGPGNRFWHSQAGIPLPDALMTVTLLLKLLSRGDEPLSEVLDRDAPAM